MKQTFAFLGLQKRTSWSSKNRSQDRKNRKNRKRVGKHKKFPTYYNYMYFFLFSNTHVFEWGVFVGIHPCSKALVSNPGMKISICKYATPIIFIFQKLYNNSYSFACFQTLRYSNWECMLGSINVLKYWFQIEE
jgi:hypothetical protein